MLRSAVGGSFSNGGVADDSMHCVADDSMHGPFYFGVSTNIDGSLFRPSVASSWWRVARGDDERC